MCAQWGARLGCTLLMPLLTTTTLVPCQGTGLPGREVSREENTPLGPSARSVQEILAGEGELHHCEAYP